MKKGKIRIIIGSIFVFLQILSLIGNAKAGTTINLSFDNFSVFLYDLLFLLTYFLIGIIGIVLLISGIYSYNKKSTSSVQKEDTSIANQQKSIVEEKLLSPNKKQHNHIFSKFSPKETNKSKKINNKTKKILILSISLPIVLLILILSINFFTAPKKAENTVAIYLSKKNDNYQRYEQFTSFKQTYCIIKFSNFKYVVELSGSAYMGLKSDTTPFSAKVEINSLTGNTSIRKLTYSNEKIIN